MTATDHTETSIGCFLNEPNRKRLLRPTYSYVYADLIKLKMRFSKTNSVSLTEIVNRKYCFGGIPTRRTI